MDRLGEARGYRPTFLAGGVIGTAVFGTLYLALAREPGKTPAIHGFGLVNVALAITALAAAALAGLAIRSR